MNRKAKKKKGIGRPKQHINYKGIAEKIIRENQCLNVPEVFMLGCNDATNVSILHQQSRAFNLAWALDYKRKINKNFRVAIVGGGFAGCTAAIALNMLGVGVDLFEVSNELISVQKKSDHRWIHPYYFQRDLLWHDWTEFPILNWVNGTGAGCRKIFLKKFQRYAEKFQNILNIKTECYVAGIDRNTDHYNRGIPILHWIDRSTGKPDPNNECYQIIILATGLGVDNRKIRIFNGELRSDFSSEPYWESGCRSNYVVNSNSDERPRILVSGCGDGGIVELLNFAIKDFDHAAIRSLIPDLFNIDLKAIESLHADYEERRLSSMDKDGELFYWLNTVAHESNPREKIAEFKQNEIKNILMQTADLYREVARSIEENDPDFFARFKSRINTDIELFFNATQEFPYRSDSSFWNEIILALLERAGGFKYLSGKIECLHKKESEMLGVEFALTSGDPNWIMDFNHVSLRFGPVKDFEYLFGNLIFDSTPPDKQISSSPWDIPLNNLLKKMHRRHFDLITEVEFPASGTWLNSIRKKITSGTKKFRFPSDLTVYSSVYKTQRLIREFLKFSRSCNAFDCVEIIMPADFEIDVDFFGHFAAKCVTQWHDNYPRFMFASYFPRPETLSESQRKGLIKLLEIPDSYKKFKLHEIMESDVV